MSLSSPTDRLVTARELWIRALLFLIGFGQLVSIRVIGELFLTDILLLGLVPLALLRMRPAQWRSAAPFIVLMMLWLVGLMVSDIVRQSPFENYARGWAKIIFFMVSFVGLLWLTDARIGRLMVFFLGVAAAGAIQTAFMPTGFQQGAPWKFGYAVPLGLLCVVLASWPAAQRRVRPFAPTALPLGMGALNLAFNFRSHYAMLVGTAAISAFSTVAARVAPGRRVVTPALVGALLVLGGVAAWGSTTLYSHAAGSGLLGQDAKQKYEMQTRGDLGLLMSGRWESLVSVRAIADSPIIGRGSWASDRSYAALGVLLRRQRGVQANESITSELIPTHSYILGAWVEAGVLGAVFWAFAFAYVATALFRLLDLQSPATPFVSYLIIQMLWAIPFSPFGAEARFMAAGQIIAAIWVFREHRSLPRPAPFARQVARARAFHLRPSGPHA